MAMRLAGSSSLPVLICLSNSNKVNKRDSVPTKLRAVNVPSQAMAFSVAGGEIELRLVRALAVKLAQPAFFRAGPVVEIRERGLGKRIFP